MHFKQVNMNQGDVNTVIVSERALPKLVAFAGVAGCGKDEAAKCLLRLGYRRHNFGDIIKRQIDPLVLQHLGFSAFTEDRSRKERIRRTLESWGEDNYDAVLAEFLRDVPERAVNTRLVRVKEARSWKELGGVIIMVSRPSLGPATEWEAERLGEFIASGLVDDAVSNDGTPAELHQKLLTVLMELGE